MEYPGQYEESKTQLDTNGYLDTRTSGISWAIWRVYDSTGYQWIFSVENKSYADHATIPTECVMLWSAHVARRSACSYLLTVLTCEQLKVPDYHRCNILYCVYIVLWSPVSLLPTCRRAGLAGCRRVATGRILPHPQNTRDTRTPDCTHIWK